VRRVVLVIALAALCPACGETPRPVTLHAATSIPERLSEWGIVFADGREFRLNEGVVPYDLNTPLFSDYALKLRTVWMPPGRSADYNDERELDFPVGTIISKTFHYRKADGWRPGALRVIRADRESELDDGGHLDLRDYALVETRLLVRYEQGWKALPYVWNAEQDEAFLAIAGDYRDIVLTAADDEQAIGYIVPDANQCSGCHTPDHSARELRPLGPKARQLNRPYAWWGDDASQLEHWQASGLLSGMSAEPPAGTRWARPDGVPAEQRARAYLDANCAHCHNPAGAADTSALDLSLSAAVDRRYGVCKPPVAVGRGSGDRLYDIYPGRPDRSIVVFRMQHSDPDIAMPELGRSAVHTEGVEAVSDWIAAMNGDCGPQSKRIL
jgi:uncharacterized repeat protein (TIGR03806 family)